MACEQSVDVEAAGLSEPAHAPRGHARDAPFQAVRLAQLIRLLLQETHERLAHVAEAEQGQGTSACARLSCTRGVFLEHAPHLASNLLGSDAHLFEHVHRRALVAAHDPQEEVLRANVVMTHTARFVY
jgi:hypothetical protein